MPENDSDTSNEEKEYCTPEDHQREDYDDPSIPKLVREQLRIEDELVRTMMGGALDDDSILEDDEA